MGHTTRNVPKGFQSMAVMEISPDGNGRPRKGEWSPRTAGKRLSAQPNALMVRKIADSLKEVELNGSTSNRIFLTAEDLQELGWSGNHSFQTRG